MKAHSQDLGPMPETFNIPYIELHHVLIDLLDSSCILLQHRLWPSDVAAHTRLSSTSVSMSVMLPWGFCRFASAYSAHRWMYLQLQS
jgi:hypothetical protein